MRRKIERAVIGLSGGVDSAVTAYLCARALGPKNVYAIRMPYKTSSPRLADDAQLVIDALGINVADDRDHRHGRRLFRSRGATPIARRRGNVMARMRMVVLFDQSAKLDALPIGTGNKTERLLGYFTWHADDTPPVNPLGDLFKTQVWGLARYLGVPQPLIDKAPVGRSRSEPNRRRRSRHHLRHAPTRSSRGCSAGLLATSRSSRRGFERSRSRSRAEARRRDALEAPSADDRHALEHRDQRVLSQAGGLLSPSVAPVPFLSP